jgi:IS30 family transposase
MEQVEQGEGSRRGVPGPAPLSRQRQEYARLVARGVSNAEACRIVGVNRRTGTRWRYGRTVPARDGTARQYPGMSELATTARPERSERYLSEEERGQIADLLRAKKTYRAIARALGRSPSTISREVARNRDEQGRYRPSAAHRSATARLARPRARKVVKDGSLGRLVQGWLDLKWSPEQISAALRRAFPNDPSRQLSPESIYQALYANCTGLQRDPWDCLRSRRCRRRPDRRGDRRRPREQTGPNARRPLSERPPDAEDRTTAGHWEGDLITGKANRSAIATLVERASGYTMLVHLPGRHTAEVTTKAVIAAFTALPAGLRRTLTWDRGTELADHAEISAATGLGIFFADPHSPWQRGSNENTNGLLRQYFPKGSNLALHSPDQLLRVQDELNGRPRKRHAWSTPETRLTALQCPNE